MDGHGTDLLGERVSVRPTPRNDLILRAMRGERTERTPVWLMRQAGRFDPAYRKLRADVGLELEELFAHPVHAADITVLPVRFGVDAAILFQDILTPLGPMGAPFVFRPGPVLERPIRTAADAARLERYDPREAIAFVAESIGLALDRLEGAVPLLGFAGAPLTLLAFAAEGGSPKDDAAWAKKLLREAPEAAAALLDRIAELTADYLLMQIECGVSAVQLFESCAQSFSEAELREWALPAQRRIFERIAGAGVPRVLFAKDIDPALMAASGADVISVGSGVSLTAARAAMPGKAIQGNVDNELLLTGTPGQVTEAAEACIREGRHTGHVLNLGHGVLQNTPVENVRAMIDAAHRVVIER
jgi:uroporphyrinogen decarboxylase